MRFDKKFKAWGHCYDCHFEGMLTYTHIIGEDYSDSSAMGVMLRQSCPACETEDNALIPNDYYEEMLQGVVDKDE